MGDNSKLMPDENILAFLNEKLVTLEHEKLKAEETAKICGVAVERLKKAINVYSEPLPRNFLFPDAEKINS